MKVIEHNVKGPIRINVAETPEDLPAFGQFVEANPLLGFDTETTGLNWWDAGRGFRCRLAQFGNEKESWVIPVELGTPFINAISWALWRAERLTAQNANFDFHVVESCYGIPARELAKKTLDTKILAHLVDGRSTKEGGIGLKLEELVPHYIDAETGAEIKKSMAVIARKYKTTKDKVWSKVDLFDPDYLLYAGMDPIFAFRLLRILQNKVPARSLKAGLVSWEHQLAHVTYQMERTGYLVDEDYAQGRIDELLAEQKKWEEVAKGYGVENLNSNQQLIEAFTSLGVKLSKTTDKGQLAMDDDVLKSIDHPLAEAVIKARRARKWRTTWFERALAGMDSKGRVHPSINSIQARTARMSITGSIPAQTFPAGNGYVRHAFLAEEGHVTVSIDFGNMELRYLAAESGDPVMREAFATGKDLHQMTADAAGVERKVGKMANFLTVYGGGWKALKQQAGVSDEVAKATIEAFNSTYKRVGVLSNRLMREAERTGCVYTATGRRLPVDPHRSYSALNYFIQSGSRDITARALIELDKAGYTPYMRLPIHDEIVFSFPKEEAEDMAREAAKLMEFTIKGVLIPTDIEIGDRSWGSVLEKEDSKH